MEHDKSFGDVVAQKMIDKNMEETKKLRAEIAKARDEVQRCNHNLINMGPPGEKLVRCEHHIGHEGDHQGNGYTWGIHPAEPLGGAVPLAPFVRTCRSPAKSERTQDTHARAILAIAKHRVFREYEDEMYEKGSLARSPCHMDISDAARYALGYLAHVHSLSARKAASLYEPEVAHGMDEFRMDWKEEFSTWEWS